MFYDRVLSGTYRVSCATCHNHDRASSNGFLIDGIEEQERDDLAINGLPLYEALKPSARHAPPLFNLGAHEFTALFADGRVSFEGTKFVSPSDHLPEGLSDVLAVQALFPAVTEDELVGTVKNEVSDAAHEGNAAIWATLVQRVRDLPDYLVHFQSAYPSVKSQSDITIDKIANAISAFIGHEWRSDQSPFDAYLRGNESALSEQQLRGMALFYGEGGCSTCHSGAFQTDHKYHVVGMPPWRFDSVLDAEATDHFDDRRGRVDVTGVQSDLFAYRTPSLRNVTRTAPYGYAGSYETLKDALRHHLAPQRGLRDFVKRRAGLGGEVSLVNKIRLSNLLSTIDAEEVSLKNKDIDDLIAFLESLTDESGLKGKLGKPVDVPSSLALD